MNMKTAFLAFAITLFSGVVFSGGGHSHDDGHSHELVTQLQAEQLAARMLKNFTRRGKLDKSWLDVQAVKTEKKVFNGRPEWVTSFTNNKIQDTEKSTLYLFMTLTGEYAAANYTGK